MTVINGWWQQSKTTFVYDAGVYVGPTPLPFPPDSAVAAGHEINYNVYIPLNTTTMVGISDTADANPSLSANYATSQGTHGTFIEGDPPPSGGHLVIKYYTNAALPVAPPFAPTACYDAALVTPGTGIGAGPHDPTPTVNFSTSGLKTWLRSDSLLGAADNSLVGEWPNLVDGEFAATANSTGTMPYFRANVLSGYPAVSFTDNNREMYYSQNFAYGNTGTFYMLARFDPPDNSTRYLHGNFAVGWLAQNAQITSYPTAGLGTNVTLLGGTYKVYGTSPAREQYHVMGTVNGTNLGQGRVDGMLYYGLPGNFSFPGSNTPQYQSRIGTGGLWVVEFLYWNRALTDAECIQVEDYFTARYFPRPPNDTAATAQVLDPAGGMVTCNFLNAKFEGSPSSSYGTLWYQYTAPQKGFFTFDTALGNTQSVDVTYYRSDSSTITSRDDLIEVGYAYDDDQDNDPYSPTMVILMEAGQTLWFEVIPDYSNELANGNNITYSFDPNYLYRWVSNPYDYVFVADMGPYTGPWPPPHPVITAEMPDVDEIDFIVVKRDSHSPRPDVSETGNFSHGEIYVENLWDAYTYRNGSDFSSSDYKRYWSTYHGEGDIAEDAPIDGRLYLMVYPLDYVNPSTVPAPALSPLALYTAAGGPPLSDTGGGGGGGGGPTVITLPYASATPEVTLVAKSLNPVRLDDELLVRLTTRDGTEIHRKSIYLTEVEVTVRYRPTVTAAQLAAGVDVHFEPVIQDANTSFKINRFALGFRQS